MSLNPQRPELQALYTASISDATPVLLELVRQQARRRRPVDLLARALVAASAILRPGSS